MLDADGDGKISYNDFHKSIGSEIFTIFFFEIHPGETLYFRQDLPQLNKQKICQQFQCWNDTCGNGNYCLLHNKMYNEDVLRFYYSMYSKCQK